MSQKAQAIFRYYIGHYVEEGYCVKVMGMPRVYSRIAFSTRRVWHISVNFLALTSGTKDLPNDAACQH